MRKSLMVILFCLLLITFTAGSVGIGYAAGGKFISIATRAPGSMGYAMYIPLAAVLTKYMRTSVSVEPIGGLFISYRYLERGEVQFVPDSNELVSSMYFNKWFWDKGRHPWLRGVASQYFSGYAFGVRANSNIYSFKDMEGKKLMHRSATGPAHGYALDLMLEKYGVKPAAKLEFSKFSFSVQQFIEGKVDVISYAVSAPDWIDADRAPAGLRFICPTQEDIDYINQKMGVKLYSVRPLPVGYLGLKAAEKGGNQFGIMAVLATSSAVPDDMVYQVVKIMYEHYNEFKDSYVTWADVTLNSALDAHSAIPYHPGAIKFFKERGIWKAEHDAWQEKILKM